MPVGTIVAMTAGHSRMLADFMRLQGAFDKDDYEARVRWRDLFVVALLGIPIGICWLLGEAPVRMVVWGATAQAAMLPVIAFATVFLVRRHLPAELAAPCWLTALLWVSAVAIAAFVLPALIAGA